MTSSLTQACDSLSTCFCLSQLRRQTGYVIMCHARTHTLTNTDTHTHVRVVACARTHTHLRTHPHTNTPTHPPIPPTGRNTDGLPTGQRSFFLFSLIFFSFSFYQGRATLAHEQDSLAGALYAGAGGCGGGGVLCC